MTSSPRLVKVTTTKISKQWAIFDWVVFQKYEEIRIVEEKEND